VAEQLVVRLDSYRETPEVLRDDDKSLSYHYYLYEGSTVKVERITRPGTPPESSRLAAYHRSAGTAGALGEGRGEGRRGLRTV